MPRLDTVRDGSPARRIGLLVLAVLTACALLSGAPADQAAAAEPTTTVGALTFKSLPFEALNGPAEYAYYYRSRPLPMVGATDAVHAMVIRGITYDFALRPAMWGHFYTNSYELTGEPWYLLRARAQADHLISTRAVEGEGWFYPSTFAYRFDSKYGGTLRPPWYSGIAQGTALGFFARLYKATGEPAYLEAAEHTLESFLVPPVSGRPWISRVDSLGYLRLEEYPGTRWQFVLNGHIEATAGLYDYYRVTGDPRALELYRGALTTLVKYGDTFRHRNWISAYSLGARAQYVGYHRRVIRQYLMLYALSGDPRFVHLANEYDTDSPASSAPGVVSVARGTYVAYRFSSSGRITGVRRLSSRVETTLRTDTRQRIRGRQSMWLRISQGRLRGYWLRETVGRVYVRGVHDALTYRPPLPVTTRAGAWRFIRVAASGAVTESVTATTAIEPVTIAGRAVVNGAPMALLASGPHEGFWVPQRAIVWP
ncbi:MAG: D-glucuronyl C5-epimerase family protein [Coriobacteriia bacterium]|nr:D-glucuronyl C5-epimerase family protein [Coriobacteriia bacterium]